MVRVPTHREPTHPGEMLLEEFLKPMGITQRELADRIHVPYQRVNEIINKRRGMTPSTALRLARAFGNSPSFWMNLQLRWDLFRAQQTEAAEIERIRPVRVTGSSSNLPPNQTVHRFLLLAGCEARPEANRNGDTNLNSRTAFGSGAGCFSRLFKGEGQAPFPFGSRDGNGASPSVWVVTNGLVRMNPRIV